MDAAARAELDRLVREHLTSLYALSLRLTGNADAAEELAQETLARAARGWQDFRGQAQFRTWLFRIAINTWRSRLGPTRQAEEGAMADLVWPGAGPHQEATAEELRGRVATLVSQLPPRQREVFVLHTYENLCYSEIGEVVGISVGNVRSHLHLARQRLREQLKAYLEA